MRRIVKVRCNGVGKHVNDVDIDKAFTTVLVTKSIDHNSQSPPERVVLNCRECTGKVIFTREMIAAMDKQHS
jgi:hypothetical protein